MGDLEKQIQQIERGEAWHETDEVVQVQVKKSLDRVIPVRLSADKRDELRREARSWALVPQPWPVCGYWSD